MYGKKLAVGMIACLGFFAHAAMADGYIQCDTCTNGQMSAAAKAHGVGRYVVGNVTSNYVVAFRVYQGAGPQVVRSDSSNANTALTTSYYDEPDTVTASESAAFTSLVNFYNAAPVGYQKQYVLQIVPAGSATTNAYKPISSSYADSPMAQSVHPMSEPAPGTATVTYPATGENAYTFVNSGSYQNAMLNWVGSQSVLGINSTISNAVNSSVFHTLGGQTAAVYITVIFTDGSHIGVGVDFTQSPPALTVNENSAVDSHGNNIPATAAAVTGSGIQEYSFKNNGNSTDYQHMATQLENFGVQVPAGPAVTYACTSSPGSGVHCVLAE